MWFLGEKGRGVRTTETRRIRGSANSPIKTRAHIYRLLRLGCSPSTSACAAAALHSLVTSISDRFYLHPARGITHILKLPFGEFPGGLDLRTSVENEWLCAQILNAYGVPTANCSIGQFGGQKALIVDRFDRRLARDKSWILRLPQEDFCQVTGVSPAQKYEAHGGPGIDTIMNILLGSEAADEDRKDFFRTQVLFWMLCAIDGHAKNFSLFLNAGGSYRLAPRYDVLSAFHVLGARSDQLSARAVKMAMGVRGSKAPHYLWSEIVPRHFEQMAKRYGLGAEIHPMMDDLAEKTPTVIQSVQSLLPANFPQDLANGIFQGLQAAANRIKT